MYAYSVLEDEIWPRDDFVNLDEKNAGPTGPNTRGGAGAPPLLEPPHISGPGSSQGRPDRTMPGSAGGGAPPSDRQIAGLDRELDIAGRGSRAGGVDRRGGGGRGDRRGGGGRGAGGAPNRPEQGNIGAAPGERGIPRPPPGFWGPRGPPPPGHPAWNNPDLQQYIPRQQRNEGGDGGAVAGRAGGGGGAPGFYPSRREGLGGGIGEVRGQDGQPLPFDAAGRSAGGQPPPPWVAAGGLPPRGFGPQQQQQQGRNAGLVPPMRGRVRSGDSARDDSFRPMAKEEEGRGPPPPPPPGDGPWRPMGSAPWENGRGDVLPPQSAGAGWGPGGRGGGRRTGPDGGMQG